MNTVPQSLPNPLTMLFLPHASGLHICHFRLSHSLLVQTTSRLIVPFIREQRHHPQEGQRFLTEPKLSEAEASSNRQDGWLQLPPAL